MQQNDENLISPNIELKKTRSSEPGMTINNVDIHSLFKPQKHARKLVEKYSVIRNPDFFLIFGLGHGYHIDQIIENYDPSNLLVIEPFKEVCEQSLFLRKSNSEVKTISSSDQKDYLFNEDFLQFIESDCSFYIHFPYFILCRDLFHKLSKLGKSS